MKQRNWGRIIFISSESAVQIPAEMIHYGMTKTAQLAIACGLAETTVGMRPTSLLQHFASRKKGLRSWLSGVVHYLPRLTGRRWGRMEAWCARSCKMAARPIHRGGNYNLDMISLHS
jgi:hypothetical protein